jgi:hypothetical protein
MLKTLKKTLLLSSSMTFLIAAQPSQADGLMTWFGGDLSDDANYAYLGGVKALNNDLNTTGYLLRGSLGYGNYEYNNGVRGIDGDNYNADFSVGYQHFFSADTRLTGYLGLSYQDYDLSPKDPSSDVDDSKFGAKVGVDFLTKMTEKVSFGILGDYSTAYDTYWSRARVGYDFGPVTVGPEIVALGNESFDEQRYGLSFTGIKITEKTGIDFSVGYADSSRTNDHSGYGNLVLHTFW